MEEYKDKKILEMIRSNYNIDESILYSSGTFNMNFLYFQSPINNKTFQVCFKTWEHKGLISILIRCYETTNTSNNLDIVLLTLDSKLFIKSQQYYYKKIIKILDDLVKEENIEKIVNFIEIKISRRRILESTFMSIDINSNDNQFKSTILFKK